MNKHFTNIEQAKEWLKETVNYVGRIFHCDNPFSEYYDTRTGEDLYTPENAAIADNKMNEAFDLFDIADEDIYGYCLDLMNND